MKKKLLAVAVAGALAAPGLALAQSSVTISGIFKTSLENISIGSPSAARAVGAKNKENRLADDSSRIIFNVVEDLGGGLAAVGQIDIRFNSETGAGMTHSGNTHVGLRSKSMGRIIFGRQDVHYGGRESNMTDLAGSLGSDSISILSFAGGGQQSIAFASRTPNIIHYLSPNWSGFTMIAAYSMSGPSGAQSDITSTTRAGNSLNLNPNYDAGNWQVGYSYWNSKNDTGGATLATGDQRASRLYGSFKIAGFKLGLAWDKSTITNTVTGVKSSDRTAWSIPVSYTAGNNQFHFHYDKARNDNATAGQDGAKMIALSYQYTLSKRTSVGVTYAKITNDTDATYNFFTRNTGSLGNSAAGATPNGGEDPRLLAATIRHAF